MYMVKCFHCQSDKNINKYNFKWLDADRKQQILALPLCFNCYLNARITYDVYGVPKKATEQEVIDFIHFDNDIEEIWSKFYYDNLYPTK